MSEKRKYLKAIYPDGNHVVAELGEALDMVGADLEYQEVGATFSLEVVEMTPEEFESLPEFEA